MSETQTPTQEPGADLDPQIPGDVPAIDAGKLEKLLKRKQNDVIADLDALSTDELTMLDTLERKAKQARPVVLKAIATVLGTRQADSSLQSHAQIQGASNANIGDRTNYASMHASEIDPAKIKFPALTKDGWVLPHPRAEG